MRTRLVLPVSCNARVHGLWNRRGLNILSVACTRVLSTRYLVAILVRFARCSPLVGSGFVFTVPLPVLLLGGFFVVVVAGFCLFVCLEGHKFPEQYLVLIYGNLRYLFHQVKYSTESEI